MDEDLDSIYGKKVRVRVMGLLVQDDRVLLVNHVGLNHNNELWLPPGGGVEFGEQLEDALKREFREEVNLAVKVGELLFVHEYINDPLHAIEFFFEITDFEGELQLGSDPEHEGRKSFQEARFVSISDLKTMNGGRLHQVFGKVDSLKEMLKRRGHFLFKTIP